MNRILSSADLLKKTPIGLGFETTDDKKHKFNLYDELCLALILLTLYVGWFFRDHFAFMPNSAQAYDLGLIGIGLLCTVFVYSLLKLFKYSQVITTSSWFRIHMTLGGLATIAILFHASFQVGSKGLVSGDMALGFLVMLAITGILGQVIYSNVKYGLLGKNASPEGLRVAIEYSEKQTLTYWNGPLNKIMQPAEQFEAKLSKLSDNYFIGLLIFLLLPLISLVMKIRSRIHVNNIIKGRTRNPNKSTGAVLIKKIVNAHVDKYINYTVKIVEYTLAQRLLSLWCTMYTTLFFLVLSLTAIHIFSLAL